MNLDTVKQAMIATPKGANIIVEWIRPAHTLKDVADSISKSVRAVGRIGIEYDHVGAVQAKRDSGLLPSVNNGLPKGQEWESYPYLILCPKSGKHLLRLYHGTSATVKPSVQWLCNGLPVERSAVESSLLASEKGERSGDCFTVNVEDITRLNQEMPVSLEQEKISVPVDQPVEV